MHAGSTEQFSATNITCMLKVALANVPWCLIICINYTSTKFEMNMHFWFCGFLYPFLNKMYVLYNTLRSC